VGTVFENFILKFNFSSDFQHIVDDGLDIRKAAFECMYTLLEQGLDRVDIMQFLEHVQAGLRDHYDIKMLTYLMTARLAQLCPQAVLQSEREITI
jgi:cullin-associated NEDD8-dissociated protein 1